MTVNVFPALTGENFVVNKGPYWSTTVKTAKSGRQVRGSLQSAPIWKFKLSYDFLKDTTPAASDVQNLWAFFNSCAGQFTSFYYQDPQDSAVTSEVCGTGNGSITSFQLCRTVGASTAYPFLEPIYAVVGTPTVYVNGTSTSYTLGSAGTISFSTAPASGVVISWTGSFYYWCHFTQDDLSPTQMVKDLWSLDGLEFESLLP